MPNQRRTVTVTFKNPTTGQASAIEFDARPYPDGTKLMRKVTRGHWQFIQTGWGESEVRRLLGGPVKVKPAMGPDKQPVTVWHYTRGLRRGGTVTFRDGVVVGYEAPPPNTALWVYHGPTHWP